MIQYDNKEWKKKKEGVYKNGEEFLCISLDYVNRKTLGFSPVRGYSTLEGYFIVRKKNKVSNSTSILADIMEDEVDEKYYLNDDQIERLMRHKNGS